MKTKQNKTASPILIDILCWCDGVACEFTSEINCHHVDFSRKQVFGKGEFRDAYTYVGFSEFPFVLVANFLKRW